MIRGNCWIDPGYSQTHRYVRVRIGDTRVCAHRLSYEFFKGSIPEGLVVDHLCEDKRCYNPSHLEAITQKENVRRYYGSGGLYDWVWKLQSLRDRGYKKVCQFLDESRR